MVVSTVDVTLHERKHGTAILGMIRSFALAGVSAFVRIQCEEFIFRISNHTSLRVRENSSTLQKISNRKTHCNKEYKTFCGENSC
jgi:hypothetical protein